MASPNPSPNGQAKPEEVKSFIQQLRESRAMKLKGKALQKSFPDDEGFAKDFPMLWEYLCATQIGEALEADPARLICHVEESTWQATLTDNALRQSLTMAGLTFRAAVKSLERALGNKDAPWVLWKKKNQESLRERKDVEKKLDVPPLT